MKQKIEQLAKGNFEYQLPEILLSEEKLQIAAVAGDTYRGSFIVSNSQGSRMKGVLYSSSRLFVLSEDKFVGEEVTINYSFIAEYMEPGERLEGEVSIITECGETVLPFEVQVEQPACESSIGKIRDMFQFTDLAKLNWAEAEQVFASETFARMLRYHDVKLLKLYRHLMGGDNVGSAMEEFLVSIRKKSHVQIKVDKDKLEYTAGEYSFLDKIVIQRSTWGYTELKISTDCEFLQPRHERIGSEAFFSNVCEESFVVDPGKLHAGLNCGHLFVESVHQRIVIPVHCYYRIKSDRKVVEARRKKQYMRDLLKNYLRFRLNHISVGKYTGEAENALLGLKNLEGGLSVAQRFYRIHLLIAQGQEQQAQDELARLKTVENSYKADPVLYGASVYLAVLCQKKQEESDRAATIIRELYKRYPEKWMLLWFLLYMDKSYPTEPEKRIADIGTAFYQGAHSPVLYYEAVAVLNEKPECLTALRLFELQILCFAVRNRALTKETALRMAYLAMQEREYSRVLLIILQEAYEQYREKEILAAICHILLIGKVYEVKSFSWYILGVREELQEEGLQEAYLMSAPEDDISIALEHSLLNYFAYNCVIPDEKRSFLYANILSHKNAYASVLPDYEQQIEDFTLAQLQKGVISRNMAVLYDEVLPKVALTSEIAGRIPEIGFYYEVECDCPNIIAVCVAHKELDAEVCVPLKAGHAYIEMFTENAEVILCDAEGNRYISTVDYGLNKLTHLESLFVRCDELIGDNSKLLLNLAEKAQYHRGDDSGMVEIQNRVVRLQGLNKEYLRDYVKGLIFHYYNNFESESLENYLLQVDLRMLARAERIRVIEYMILSDLFNVALKALDEFGFEGVEVKRLARLCNRLITNADGMEKVDVLLAICAHVFEAGRYDEVILRYLTDYFYGTTLQMFEVWKAARTMELDTMDLEERLLGQMLFAESYISSAKVVFNNYYRSGTNKKLIRAFLSYYAYKYLMNDRLVEQDILDVMRREIAYEDNEVCLLAVMKWYSTQEQLTDSQVAFVDLHLNRFEQRDVILPFFREFKGSMRIPQNLYDKYYVEYRTNPKNRVTIHYTFEAARGENGFVKEEMTNVCYGIFVKEFVLFSNESLQYYIVEECDGEENITESIQVRLSPEQTDGEDTKYYQLNEIIAARDLQDETTALKLLDHYVRKDYAIAQLFKPL